MSLDWDTFYYICIAVILSNMVAGWTVLIGTPIYYGRLSGSISKILINPKLAWFLFEVPNLLWVAYFVIVERTPISLGLILFTVHYFNRDVLYPLSLKTTTKVPADLIVLTLLFTTANGYLQCFASQEPSIPNRFIQAIGLVVFVIGMWINIKSDNMLQEAKERVSAKDSTGKKQYAIVRGFLFDLVSSPNYLGEIIEWFGYCMVCQHSMGLLFALSTLDILTPGAIKRHQWNLKNIEGYPKERKALIPYIL